MAEQETLKAKNVTVQDKEEARQKVIAAEAAAKAMQIKTQSLSQNRALVQYEAVQKWNGQLMDSNCNNDDNDIQVYIELA